MLRENGGDQETIKRLTLACEGYKQEIERLKTGLRQRGAANGGGEVQVKTIQADQKTEGMMSVRVAAIIAFIAFLLGVMLI